MSTVVKTVGQSGQIALGKAYAGRHVLVDELEPGVWLVKLGEFIPDREGWVDAPAPAMTAGLPLYQATHAVHSCFVLHEGRILCACEDIGRHNALDKAVGSVLLAGVPLSECVLYTSGRVPMDMVRKAIRAGVPALVSKTMPTVQSLELGAEYGLQFVCGRKHPLTLKERAK